MYLYITYLHTNIRAALSSPPDLWGSTQRLLWKVCMPCEWELSRHCPEVDSRDDGVTQYGFWKRRTVVISRAFFLAFFFPHVITS
jgi:hypothetical protein